MRAFGGVKTESRLGEVGVGAWEVAMRLQLTGLNDGRYCKAVEADSMTLGNWYRCELRFFG